MGLKVDLNLLLVLKREKSNLSVDAFTLKLPTKMKRVRILSGAPVALEVFHKVQKYEPVPRALSFVNGSEVAFRCVVRDKFGNKCSVPSSGDATHRLVHLLSNSLADTPVAGIASGSVDFTVKLNSSFFQMDTMVGSYGLSSTLPFSPSAGPAQSAYLESFKLGKESIYVGDCVEMKGNGPAAFKAIVEAILPSASNNEAPALWIRYFVRWGDRALIDFLALPASKSFSDSLDQRVDELLLTTWTVVRGVTPANVSKKVTVFSRQTYFELLRCRGLDPNRPPHPPLPDVYFCSKLAAYAPNTNRIECVYRMEDEQQLKSCPPFTAKSNKCLLVPWADNKLIPHDLPASNTLLDAWVESVVDATPTGRALGKNRLCLSVNGHCIDPKANSSSINALEPGCIVLVQPLRLLLAGPMDIFRFALVEESPKPRIALFEDLLVSLQPSDTPSFLEVSLVNAPTGVLLQWSLSSLSPAWKLQAPSKCEISLRVVVKSEAMRIVTGRKGTLSFGAQKIPIGDSGEVEFETTMPIATETRELKFKANNQRLFSEIVAVNVDCDVSVGAPHRVLLSRSVYSHVSGEKLLIEVQLQDTHGNSAFTPETAPELSFAYTDEGTNVSPCNDVFTQGEYLGKHRWSVELPHIFARAGRQNLQILGSYRPPSEENRRYIEHSTIIAVDVQPGPAEIVAIPQLPIGLELRTQEYLPSIVVQVFDHQNPLFRNVVPVDGDVSVKLHPVSGWLEPDIPPTMRLPLLRGTCQLAADQYKIISAPTHNTATISFQPRVGGRGLPTGVLNVIVLPSEATPLRLQLSGAGGFVVANGKLVDRLAAGAALPPFGIMIISETEVAMPVEPFVGALFMKIYRKGTAGVAMMQVDEIRAVPSPLNPLVAVFSPHFAASFSRAGDYTIEFSLADPRLRCVIQFSVRPSLPTSIEILSTDLTKDHFFLDQVRSFEYQLKDFAGNAIMPTANILRLQLANLPPRLASVLTLRSQDRPSRNTIGRVEISVVKQSAETHLAPEGPVAAELVCKVDSPEEVAAISVRITLMMQTASMRQELLQRRRDLDTHLSRLQRDRTTAEQSETIARQVLADLSHREASLNRQVAEERYRAEKEQERLHFEGHELPPSLPTGLGKTLGEHNNWEDHSRGLLGTLAYLFYVDHSAQELGGPIDGEHPAKLLNVSLSNRLKSEMSAAVLDPRIPRTAEELQESRSLSWKLFDELKAKFPRIDVTCLLICDLSDKDWHRVVGRDNEQLLEVPQWPDYRHCVGCLGYAANLLKLSPVAHSMKLRARLLKPILRNTLVFRTEKDLGEFSKKYGTQAAICLNNPFQSTKQGRVEIKRGARSWREYRGPLFGVRALPQRSFMNLPSTLADLELTRSNLERAKVDAEAKIRVEEERRMFITNELTARMTDIQSVDEELRRLDPIEGAGTGAAPRSKRQKRDEAQGK